MNCPNKRRERIFDLKLFLKTKVLFLILAFAVSAFAQKQDDAVQTSSLSKSPYKVGEKLTYSISFATFAGIAHAELAVVGKGIYFSREAIELRATVQSSETATVIFDINSDFLSYIDPESGRPYKTRRVVRDGINAEDESQDFNQTDLSIPPSRKGEFIGEYDFLSALYRLRAMPLTEDAAYRFTARFASTAYDAELQVTGRKTIKTTAGTFNTIATQIRVYKNKQADNYRIKIYFNDDERHVPVLITIQRPSGEIRAELASSELPKEKPSQKEPTTNKTPPQQQNIANNSAANTGQPTASTPGITANPTNTNPNQIQGIPGIPNNVVITQPNNPTTPNTNSTLQPISKPTQLQPKPFPKDFPFSANEQLNFNLYWQTSQQPVGKVMLQVSERNFFNGRDALMLTAKVDSAMSAIAKFFTINDTFTSFVEPESLLPFQNETKLQGNNSHYNQSLKLDQDRGSVITDKNSRIEIPVGTHDILSMAYALRLFDLTPNKKTPASVLVGNRAFILTVTSVRREVIELGGQSVKAVQLKLTTDDPTTNTDDAIGDKYVLRLWVSEDSRRFPLRLSITLPEGTLRADLAIVSPKQ
jgi:hypothetical protein